MSAIDVRGSGDSAFFFDEIPGAAPAPPAQPRKPNVPNPAGPVDDDSQWLNYLEYDESKYGPLPPGTGKAKIDNNMNVFDVSTQPPTFIGAVRHGQLVAGDVMGHPLPSGPTNNVPKDIKVGPNGGFREDEVPVVDENGNVYDRRDHHRYLGKIDKDGVFQRHEPIIDRTNQPQPKAYQPGDVVDPWLMNELEKRGYTRDSTGWIKIYDPDTQQSHRFELKGKMNQADLDLLKKIGVIQ